MSIGEEINQPGGIPAAGDILPLSWMPHPRADVPPVLDDHPGSVLRKLDWIAFIKELTILPYFSTDAILTCSGRRARDVVMQHYAS